MNPKISLGIAVAILLAVISHQIYSYMSYVPLREHIEGKWANTFGSFSINTKDHYIAILDVADVEVKRDYEIVEESKWSITLMVKGTPYKMDFDKEDDNRKFMVLTKGDEAPARYQHVLEGDKDPSVHKVYIDDPDQKLKEYNLKRKKGEI